MKRQNNINNSKSNKGYKRYPLIEFGITEKLLNYCYAEGLIGVVYMKNLIGFHVIVAH